MKREEAYKAGLQYTGISFAKWNTGEKEKYKAEVAEIKKKYKVRAVLVEDSNGWQSYYGDDNFCLVQYETVESLSNRLHGYEKRKEKIIENYKKELAELETWKYNLENKIEKIKKIIK